MVMAPRLKRDVPKGHARSNRASSANRIFKVGVFTSYPRGEGRKPLIKAYSLWYNPEWQGCCQHTIEALNGSEAKRKAIQIHKNICMKGD